MSSLGNGNGAVAAASNASSTGAARNGGGGMSSQQQQQASQSSMKSSSSSHTATRDFDKIYLGGKNGPLAVGRFKVSEAGVGWKNSQTGQIVTVASNDILKVDWIRVARDYEFRVLKRGGAILKFDGFQKSDFDSLNLLSRQYYAKHLTVVEVSTRGYNWGQAEFQSSHFSFSVQGKPAFELPLTDVANTQVAGKSEVLMEFALPVRPKNERSNEDTLVEMRFYVPGGVTESMIRDGDGSGDAKILKDRFDENGVMMEVDLTAPPPEVVGDQEIQETGDSSAKAALDSNGEALSAAALFCETIKQKSDASTAASEIIVSFDETLSMVPRGRFKIDMHIDHLRLRGKTHDYKILYSQVNRLILVPKPDDMHWNFVVGIHPPLRQGQTKYPFVVFQFEKEQEIEVELHIADELLASDRYASKLMKSYDCPTYRAFSEIFIGLTGKKLQVSSPEYVSSQNYHGIRGFYKAQEATIFPLEKGWLIISKPTLFFSFVEISEVMFSRVGNTKAFEIQFKLTGGQDYAFTQLAREEFTALENFCKLKKLRVRNEIENLALFAGADMDDDEMGAPAARKRKTEKGAYVDDRQDESESEDEDFVAAEEGSEVDEEFDSDFQSSDEEGGEGEGGERKRKNASDDESGEEEEGGDEEGATAAVKPPKKKKATEGGGEGGIRKKKEKKEGPKKPLTSYIFFCNHHRGIVKEKNSALSMVEISKELGILWKAATADEKAPFEEQAVDDKERYARELKDFERTGKLPEGYGKKDKKGPEGGATKKSVTPSSPKKVKVEGGSPARVKTESSGGVGKVVKSEEYVGDSSDEGEN